MDQRRRVLLQSIEGIKATCVLDKLAVSIHYMDHYRLRENVLHEYNTRRTIAQGALKTIWYVCQPMSMGPGGFRILTDINCS